ncbi:MAG: glycosyltransferase [Betaproteobacteria bacterium]|nr:glycosyltransferase [Betaproteobacteria bacterium]MCL2885636.1 glycosyltransferase [Betaproteobacteria bacterium]
MAETTQRAARDMAGDVTVIIPTMAEKSRHDSLLRAIASLSDVTHVVVVINGNRRSPDVENSLLKFDHVELLSLEIASLPLAILAGRRAVKTTYFCFLDDDDEYLPGAIAARVAALAGRDDVDFLVTNGYRHLDGVDRLCLDNLDRVPAAPLAELFRQNWLASCGSLFRSERIGAGFFEEPHPYAEWTWLAFKLCMAGKKMATLDQPTFRIYDTPNSASKLTAYSEAFHTLYRRMLEKKPPKFIISIIRQRIGEDLHCRADSLRQQGKMTAAWGAHLRSLLYPGGWRYLPFFRHLVFNSRNFK